MDQVVNLEAGEAGAAVGAPVPAFCVLTISATARDQRCPTPIRLLGPFGSDDAAAAWGYNRRHNPHHNSWTVVRLTDTTVPVVTP